jgi:hypothetical protein
MLSIFQNASQRNAKADELYTEYLEKLHRAYEEAKSYFSPDILNLESEGKIIHLLDTSFVHEIPKNQPFIDVVSTGHSSMHEQFFIVPPQVEIVFTTRIGLALTYDICSPKDSARFDYTIWELHRLFQSYHIEFAKALKKLRISKKAQATYLGFYGIRFTQLFTELQEILHSLEMVKDYQTHFLPKQDSNYIYYGQSMCPDIAITYNLITYIEDDQILRAYFYENNVVGYLTELVAYHIHKLGNKQKRIRIGVLSCLVINKDLPPIFWDTCLGVFPYRQGRRRSSFSQVCSSGAEMTYYDRSKHINAPLNDPRENFLAPALVDEWELPDISLERGLHLFDYEVFRNAYLNTFKIESLQRLRRFDPVVDYIVLIYRFLQKSLNDGRLIIRIKNEEWIYENNIAVDSASGFGVITPEQFIKERRLNDYESYLKYQRMRRRQVRDVNQLQPNQFTTCIFMILYGSIYKGTFNKQLIHDVFLTLDVFPRSADAYLQGVLRKIYNLILD